MIMACEARLRNHGHWSPFETCGLAGVRASAHTQEIVDAESREKNSTDARTALVTHPWCGPGIVVVRKEKNNVFVSYRGRVTKVAPECLRKASVVEQMSWDITTKEKVLFEKCPR